MRKKAIVIGAICSCFAFIGSARSEVVLLATLEKRAVERHASLSASAAKVRAAAAEVRQAESSYRPRFGLSADANAAPGRTLVPVTVDGTEFLVQGAPALSKKDPAQNLEAFKPQLRTGFDLVLGATIYDFGRTGAAVAASRAKYESSRAEQDVTRAQIIANVRGAYLVWLNAYQVNAMSEKASKDAALRCERVRGLVEEGVRPRADLMPVEADRLLSELEREQASGEQKAARMVLEQKVGETLGPAAQPDISLLEIQSNSSPPNNGSHPALRMLERQRASLMAAARAQRRMSAPVLSTEIAAGFHSQMREFGDWRHFPTYTAGLMLGVPLWDGGSARAAADAADARADEVRILLEHERNERAQELERALNDVAEAERRSQIATHLLEICKTRVSDVEAGYEMGAMQFDQVQQAYALLRRADTELLKAKLARAEAVLRVIQ